MDVLKTLGTRLLNGWQLSRLATFEVAARHESFALAADELALTPSAVSHRINQLEEELGDPALCPLAPQSGADA